jgi:hypothetical protein
MYRAGMPICLSNDDDKGNTDIRSEKFRNVNFRFGNRLEFA